MPATASRSVTHGNQATLTLDEVHRDDMRIELPACPKCAAPIAPRVRIVVERIRRASRRPVLPEMLHCCDCGELFIVSLQPESGR